MTTLFIGLGAMGAPMIRNLAAKTNDEVLVFDVSPATRKAIADETGARPLAALDQLPAGVNAVVLMLPNSRIVEGVLSGAGGVLQQLDPGSIVIDMSSSEPESSRLLAAEAVKRGVGFVDAPVSGGTVKAISGELTIMVGGTDDAVARATPILRTMGTSIVHVGGPGAGDAAKALNNLLSATNIAAVAEVLTAATKFGIDPAVMLDVINRSTSRSQASTFKYPRHVFSGRFDSGFALSLLQKDLGIAGDLTQGAGIETPVTDAARRITAATVDLVDAPGDHVEIARYYETRNDVAFRGVIDAAQ